MIFRLQEFYNIKLNDSVLIKIEDSIKNKEELLVTVRASSYGFLNGNSTVYRHDTVKNNIGTFIHPTPKPIIENHMPKKSKKYGSIIAVDYKQTEYYDELSKQHKLEDLTTEEYIDLCKKHIIPLQLTDSDYSGLGYCETVGKLNDIDGIKKVLNKEFLKVSIGADPKKLVCSYCLQDQVEDVCEHFQYKGKHGIWMLAEELEYEELSFLRGKNPADPRGKITRIHDGKVEEIEYDLEDNYLNIDLDVFNIKDFFKLADETKTIVCMDNICKVINREEEMARKKEEKKIVSLSYVDEFSKEKIESLGIIEGEKQDGKLIDSEASEELATKLSLNDELEDNQFAIIQKTEDEIKRRFPLHDELNVKLAIELLDSAEDLTEAEITKAQASIKKASKKLGIEVEFKPKEEKEETRIEDAEKNEKTEPSVRTLEDVIGELKSMIESIEETKLQDEEQSPISKIFDMLTSLAYNIKWAGEALQGSLDYYLKEKGKEAIEKGTYDSLQDELKEAKEEIELLEDLNRDLNVQVRKSLVDEIIDAKEQLGLLTDSIDEEKKKLISHPYNVLVDQVSDYRKLKSNLNITKVINNKDITTVTDPTLQDATDEELDVKPEVKLEDNKKTSEEEILKRIIDIFTK